MQAAVTFRIPYWRLLLPMLVFGQVMFWLGIGAAWLLGAVAFGAPIS